MRSRNGKGDKQMDEQERQPGDSEYGKETGREWTGDADDNSSGHAPASTSETPVASDLLRPESDGGEASDVEGHGATYRGGG